ncbi:MAG: DNA polymerase III subunit gamma/tau [Acholeplasmatales bacterium]|jgi:DNA polymerase-3 subunit gamma/tau|nr:DNA polymerase III subunit gamma/tau [Acholeplasmatales bacterium]
MAYQVLYRTYRPKNFDSVVGLSTIVTILKNQIKNNKVGHAYIFSGPRGTGKTSIAKIFAKAINCQDKVENRPCGKCESCLAIENSSNLDVIEIDAASNNGVDEIRNLKDGVKYLPTSNYKVYIIDEFHMLTNQAFNALLKTLEEPPSNVVFILATTELHKVPATILSRCQRYTFANIEASEVVKKLEYIAKEEKIEYEPKALDLIAKISEGGLRDAISLLDQCLAMGSAKISVEDVNIITGGVKEEVINSLFESIIKSDANSLIKIFNKEIDTGKDILRILSDLLIHIKDVLVGIVANRPAYLKYSSAKIAIMSAKIAEIMNLVRFSNQKRILVQMELINLTLSFKQSEEKPPVNLAATNIKNFMKVTSGDLNNIVNTANKDLRLKAENLIQDHFKSSADALERKFAEIGIKAVNDNEAILSANTTSDANYLMCLKIKNDIINKLVTLGLGISNYYVVTNQEWNNLSKIIIEQKKQGLNSISLPELNLSTQYEIENKSTEDINKEGLTLFGSDFIIEGDEKNE